LHHTLAVTLAPPLKWAGGKRWLVPRLQPIWAAHAHRLLAEPFVGGMAVALGLQATTALLNDTNPHLINFYRWLQRGFVISIEMENDRHLYYQHRQRFNALTRRGDAHTAEAAALFYYLNRTGFNGLCRFNSKGEFNVPFGRYKTIRYTTDFSPYVEALRGWQFRSDDFSALSIRDDAFIYADPPYDVEFTAYSPGGFNWRDQVRFAEWLAQHPGPVIVSNQATERILELYRRLGFKIEIIEAPRFISCNGDRTPAREMFASKGIDG
jgi:DNA adenine methylase